MLKRELRLLKSNETPAVDGDQHDPVDTAAEAQVVENVSDGEIIAEDGAVDTDEGVTMTPAEAAEAARFRRMAADKAARQVMLEQIMAELAEFDDLSSAA